MRVAVIGAGIAGITCAQALRARGLDVVVLDRGRVPGGRLASRRFNGRYVDLGASYFTVTGPGFAAVVADWEARGLARPWTDRFHVYEVARGGWRDAKTGPIRWAAPGGLRSLVVDLAAGLEIRQQTYVQNVRGGSVDGEQFDAIVVAMPDPQALELLDPSLEQERTLLSDRPWDAVLVLAARWAARTWDFDGVFVHGSDVLEWIADDGARRGDGAPVLTAHSTPAFASTRLAVPAEAGPEMVAALCAMGLPEPAEVLRVQRWSKAKPVGERAALFALTPAGIGFCGDSWGSARVETAWRSGTALAQAL